MRTDDLFWIASSPSRSRHRLMMLVDEGKVKLDDPVEKYLAGVPRSVVDIAEQDTDHWC